MERGSRTMIKKTTLEQRNTGIVVNVPLKIKRQAGRKEIILPDYGSPYTPGNPSQQEAIAKALARAHRWKKLIDNGKFASITELAEAIGMDKSFVAKLFRLTLLAPDIVEMILAGKEPSGLSLTRLTKQLPMAWDEQCSTLGTSHHY
ncbi:MAG: hypothetical protein M1305_05095 [Candidatus Marsarchaeota archaeon]|nr:hypothetical protein [Candidatus Marsarchaeota archaeon]